MPKIETIKLSEPLKEGENKITSIELRRPTSGDLRGLSTAEVINMQVDAHLKLLPRLITPILTINQLDALSPQDLIAIQGKIVGFFMPNGQMPTDLTKEAP